MEKIDQNIENSLLEMSVEEFAAYLPNESRIVNALNRNSIFTLKEFFIRYDCTSNLVSGLGTKTIEEIMTRLREYGVIYDDRTRCFLTIESYGQKKSEINAINLETSIWDFCYDMPDRNVIFKSLGNSGIRNVGDLIDSYFERNKLTGIRGISIKQSNAIKEKLAKNGFVLDYDSRTFNYLNNKNTDVPNTNDNSTKLSLKYAKLSKKREKLYMELCQVEAEMNEIIKAIANGLEKPKKRVKKTS